MDLDRIDREILRTLNLKGRLPVVELAKQVNLTTSPCSDRVKRLEKEGYIKGYHAELNPEKLGLDVQFSSIFALIKPVSLSLKSLPKQWKTCQRSKSVIRYPAISTP